MGQLIWSLWGHYMALTSAAALMDGALWSLMYNYPSLDAFRGNFLFRGMSFPGLFSIFFAIITVVMEKKMKLPVAVKALFYLVVSLNGFLQFSCIVGAQCYLFTSIVFMLATFTGESGDLKTDRKEKEAHKGGA